MRHRYLEITFRRGRALAAYYYLPRQAGDVSARSERHEQGLVMDFAADGRPLGIEITSPSSFTLAALNKALATAQLEPAAADDVAPLLAAKSASDAAR